MSEEKRSYTKLSEVDKLLKKLDFIYVKLGGKNENGI